MVSPATGPNAVSNEIMRAAKLSLQCHAVSTATSIISRKWQSCQHHLQVLTTARVQTQRPARILDGNRIIDSRIEARNSRVHGLAQGLKYI